MDHGSNGPLSPSRRSMENWEIWPEMVEHIEWSILEWINPDRKTLKGLFSNGPSEYITPRMVESERLTKGCDTLRKMDLQPFGHTHLV